MAKLAFEVFEYCKNYDEIKNTKVEKYDMTTSDLIDYYENYVFKCNIKEETEIEKLKELDEIMYCYINDYKFNEFLREELSNIPETNMEIYTNLDCYLIHFYSKYNENYKQKRSSSRWL